MDFRIRRRGRVAEGGGLLNRYTPQRRIEGSNPLRLRQRLRRIRSESVLGVARMKLSSVGSLGRFFE